MGHDLGTLGLELASYNGSLTRDDMFGTFVVDMWLEI